MESDWEAKYSCFLTLRLSGAKIRAARLSALQFEVLIQFMQENPHFAVGRAAGGSYSKEEHDALWRTLSTKLNETEGPMKSVTKWQKCWVDLKSNARSRAAKARAKSLDSPLPSGSVFTQWDERVLKLLDDIANDMTTIAPSPLQLLEVGLSEKIMPLSNGVSLRLLKPNKFRKIVPKQTISTGNGYQSTENGSETMESINLHGFDGSDMAQAEDDMEELIADVKSEVGEEWLQDERENNDGDYTMDPSRSDSDSEPTNYLPSHLNRTPLQDVGFPECVSQDRPRKRKSDDPFSFSNFEDSVERLSKKICGSLDRMAAAAEEANEIQMGMVNAMNRLASTFEQLIPVIAKVMSKS